MEDSRRNKLSSRGFECCLLALISREMRNTQMKGVPYQMAAAKKLIARKELKQEKETLAAFEGTSQT